MNMENTGAIIEQGQCKSSHFNDYLGNLDGKWVVMNHLSGAMIEIDQPIYELLMNNDLAPLEGTKGLESLKFGKFVVSGDDNEVVGYKRARQEWSETARFVGLQIVPTLACNFKCPYCYENQQFSHTSMLQEVMDGILNYLNEAIKPTTQMLSVSWYGGEPLLAMKQIEFLSKAFMKLAEERNLQYKATCVTNGYLLSKKNVDTLLQYKVRALQVTLDGPKAIHDKRRKLADGTGTWQTIIDNIKYALSQKLMIHIRVNIDKENIDYVEELCNELKEENIFDEVTVSLGAVLSFGNVCRSVEDTIITLEDANKKLGTDKIRAILKKSIGQARRHVPNYTGCVAVATNSLIVGPSGELYKCTKTIGSPEEICGDIFNVDKNHPNIKKWEGVGNLEIDNCQKCSLLPVCSGDGCAFDQVISGKPVTACNNYLFRKEYASNHAKLYLEKKQNCSK